MEQEAQFPELTIPENFNNAKFEIQISSLSTTSNATRDDMVCHVQYVVWCEIDGQRQSHESELIFGPEQLAAVENPIPFADLTEDIVKSWVEQIAPLTHIYYSLCWRFLPDPIQKRFSRNKQILPWSA